MAKQRKYFQARGISKKDKEYIFRWIIVVIVFVAVLIIVFIKSFFFNCIFHWPIRWDIKNCWNEQIKPSQQKAGEAAGNFIP